jgi:hypothetical protein
VFMKKLILTLIVLALAVPLVQAEVNFVATDNGDGTCTVTFDANDLLDVQVVAMGLDITVDGADPDDAITAVGGIDSFFDIFMDAAYDMESDPCTPGYTYGAGGDPIAKVAEAGKDTLPSLSFCISMGGLGGDVEPLVPAPDNGTAFVLHAGNAAPGAPSVTGTISINALRGGVVGTDTEAMDTNLSIPFAITITPECYAGQPDYQMWKDWGSPECWCIPRQCHGDAEGTQEGSPFGGYYYVGVNDLNLLAAAYLVKESPKGPGIATITNGICADFDHVQEGSPFGGYYRVGVGDLNILAANYLVKEAPKGPGVPPDCLD